MIRFRHKLESSMICASVCVPGASYKPECVPGIAIILAAMTTCITTYDHLQQVYGHARHQLIHADMHKEQHPQRIPFKAQLCCKAGVVSKTNSRRCWPLIRDICVPSHIIEAGFPEKETTLEQYDKTNRFKDIKTVFVIGTFFMVHGNCFLWDISFHSHSSAQHGECV